MKAKRSGRIIIILFIVTSILTLSGIGGVTMLLVAELKPGKKTALHIADEIEKVKNTAGKEEMQLSRDDTIKIENNRNSLQNELESLDGGEAGLDVSSDYMISDSNTRYLTTADLEGLTKDQLKIARNEIYARHGRGFDDNSLQDYFNHKPWYERKYSPQEFDGMGNSMLNDYEYENTLKILEYEELMGYR